MAVTCYYYYYWHCNCCHLIAIRIQAALGNAKCISIDKISDEWLSKSCRLPPHTQRNFKCTKFFASNSKCGFTTPNTAAECCTKKKNFFYLDVIRFTRSNGNRMCERQRTRAKREKDETKQEKSDVKSGKVKEHAKRERREVATSFYIFTQHTLYIYIMGPVRMNDGRCTFCDDEIFEFIVYAKLSVSQFLSRSFHLHLSARTRTHTHRPTQFPHNANTNCRS